LAKLQYPTAFVVDKNNVESGGKNWSDKPNGTGPFKLTEWQKDTKVTLTRNPNYHLGPAKVERVLLNIAGGNGMTMYENSEIDITPIGISDVERVSDPKDPLNKQLVIGKELSTGYIGFNVEVTPFDDVKVRQAFAQAVDIERINKVVNKDLAPTAKSILPPDMPGYNTNVKPIKFDVAAAKALLQESKYAGNLPPVTLTRPGSTTTVGPYTEAILEQWKTNLGVDVKVQQVEFATYLSDMKRNPALGKKNKYQMYEAGWSADYPDPQDFVEVLFASSSLENNGAYKNTDVDSLVLKARSETDEGKRFALYQQAEQIILNEAGLLPMYHNQTYELVKPYVKGYQPVPMIIPNFRYVSIEK
jgi:ABC-type transport system substrate-binding protein